MPLVYWAGRHVNSIVHDRLLQNECNKADLEFYATASAYLLGEEWRTGWTSAQQILETSCTEGASSRGTRITDAMDVYH